MGIAPMLLQEIEYSADVWEKYKGWFFQEKQNGDRAIFHISRGRGSAIRNRQDKALGHLFPEVMSLEFKGVESAIVDGEIAVLDEHDKSVFYGGINQRDKVLRKESVDNFPATFIAFDLLYLNGQSLVNLPYEERLNLLNEHFEDKIAFKIIKNIENPKEYWETKIRIENREGLVIKNPKAKYYLNYRSKDYLKLKNYKETKVTVSKVEPNNMGLKIYGFAEISGSVIEVECQIGGKKIDIKPGEVVPVVYLDIVNNKLVQPHKIKGWGLE